MMMGELFGVGVDVQNYNTGIDGTRHYRQCTPRQSHVTKSQWRWILLTKKNYFNSSWGILLKIRQRA